MMAVMRLGLLLASVLVLPSAACGDDGGGADTGGASTTADASTTGPGSTGSTGGSGSGSASTATSDTTETPADTTAATGQTTAATESTTGSTTDASTTGSTTEGGMGSLDAVMSNLQIFQDCMPIVPPDPAGASFMLELTNTGDAPATATVTSAVFVDAGGMQAATLDVMPDAFGPVAAGDSTQIMVSKVVGSLAPANGCETLQCGQSYTLELVLDVDGVEVIASDTADVGCAF